VGTGDQPTAAVFAPGGGGDGVLGERAGTVRRIVAGQITDEVVLDLSQDTQDEGDGGLLGLAYAPDGGWLYVYRATAGRDDVVTAHAVDAKGSPEDDAGREILRIDHPDSIQHHGGAFLFGPDEHLYIGLGDGGGLGDPRDNAQDPSELLGKVLRIDPTPDGERPYRIPPDNPFVDREGHAPEVWLLGVRNPFRMGLDRATGDLWLGDVGQSCWEELNRLPTGPDGAGGANLGWNLVEGTAPFLGGEVAGRALAPQRTYAHRAGWCSVVAGYVPRASPVPVLVGMVLHTDYCAGDLVGLRTEGPAAGEVVDTGIDVDNPIAVVPGREGHPWVLSLGGEVLEVRSTVDATP
jgi:glucose/arabinose dehydrogenase